MAEYYTDDITWCSNRRCKNKKCERNQERLRPTPYKAYSFADLEGTAYCIKRTPEERERKEK